jgi:hypothetical protein
VPAHPPLPTPANLPFQFSSGIHTSNSTRDWAVGLISPATRQKGGSPVMAFVLPGGVNDPVVTAWAAVMVVSGRERAARRSHAVGVCAPGRTPWPEARISTINDNDRG